MIRLLALALLGCFALLAVPAHARTEGGDLLWQAQFDLAGGVDRALAVAASHGRVVAVGSAQNEDGNTDFLVRTYNAKTGALLWTDRIDIAQASDTATAVVLDGDRVIVGGTGTDASGSNRVLLRAYVAKSGELAWEDRSPLATLDALDMAGSHVVVTGTTTALTGQPRLLVRVYVAKSGVLKWQDQPLPPLGYDRFDGARRGATIHGQKLFVVGTVRLPPPAFNPSCLVRAYTVGNGRLAWESLHQSSCQAVAIATDGKRVIVAGQGNPALDDIRIQSYDADTGQFLWEGSSGWAQVSTTGSSRSISNASWRTSPGGFGGSQDSRTRRRSSSGPTIPRLEFSAGKISSPVQTHLSTVVCVARSTSSPTMAKSSPPAGRPTRSATVPGRGWCVRTTVGKGMSYGRTTSRRSARSGPTHSRLRAP
jgi:hypothetical protein